MSGRVLIVEDDPAIADLLAHNLRFEGFTVEAVTGAGDAVRRVVTFLPDLVIVDLVLPDGDGLDVCRVLREQVARPGIIVVTSRTSRDDKIAGFAEGADDYVTKPFALDELLARVHAVLRRSHPELERITLGSIVIDFTRMSARKSGEPLSIRPREMAVLRELAVRRGDHVSRDQLLASVWGCHELSLTRTVDICIARLRRKIEPDPQHPRYLRTAHGEGYCLIVDPPA